MPPPEGPIARVLYATKDGENFYKPKLETSSDETDCRTIIVANCTYGAISGQFKEMGKSE